MAELEKTLEEHILSFQQDEIDGHEIYTYLAAKLKNKDDQAVIAKIAEDELGHYYTWKRYSGKELKANRFKVFWYKLLFHLFGYTFVIKLQENGEEKAQAGYAPVLERFPELDAILKDEEEHEDKLLAMMDEESLKYSGSVVLGLNDALVELTGALAGLTLAFQNSQTIALSGMITGIAAALSMAASEYLSTSAEKDTERNPGKSALYTGVAYIITVALLILPYLIISDYFVALGVMLLIGVMIIALFNYYSSVVNDEPFLIRFLRMTGISLGVATISFVIGYFVGGVI